MATKRVFSASILKHIESHHQPEHFTAQFENGFWRSPRFSLRRQADLRKACLLNNVDPASIGLPEKSCKREEKRLAAKSTWFSSVRAKPPKGHKHQRNYDSRKQEIEQALHNMPKKIQEWKGELVATKEKSKSSLPF